MIYEAMSEFDTRFPPQRQKFLLPIRKLLNGIITASNAVAGTDFDLIPAPEDTEFVKFFERAGELSRRTGGLRFPVCHHASYDAVWHVAIMLGVLSAVMHVLVRERAAPSRG